MAHGQRGSWLVTSTLGLWLPQGLPVRLGGRGDQLVVVQVDAVDCPIGWVAPTPVVVDSFVRGTLLRLSDVALGPAERRRTEQVLFDVLVPVDPTEYANALPVPDDERVRSIVDGLRADPGDRRTLGEWGRVVGASARNLTRLFVADTGMTFGQWREEIRIHAAIGYLMDGVPTTKVAAAVGYRTPSAFVQAFRRRTGVTPTQYLRSHRREYPAGTG